jgi:6-phosphogluconate dehydrogenase
MQIGMVGLGRMGANMARRLMRGGHEVVGFAAEAASVEQLASEGGTGATTLDEFAGKLRKPRHAWVMVPAGNAIEQVVTDLAMRMERGDTIIDGGNSSFKDSMRRAAALDPRGIQFLDAGTSGGVWGLTEGYCLMVGGPRAAFDRIEPALRTLAPDRGYLYTGPSGSGHFTKMVHNAIEYGMMQAYAEGFEILQSSEFDLDLPAIADLWNHGSVVRSWLLQLVHAALEADPKLEKIRGWVEDSGEGRWTLAHAIESAVPAPVIALSLMARFRSRQEDPFGNKLLAALRHQFGGHAVRDA